VNLLASQQFLLDSASATCIIGTSSAPFMSSCSVCLVNSNSITLNGSTTLAQVAPITGGYDGYGDVSITWNLPSVSSAGVVEVVGDVKIFRPTDSSAPQTMYGVYLLDAASTTVLAAAPFDGGIGIPMQSPLNTITIVLVYQPLTASLICTVIA
jgi:hypothetical protein